MLSTQQKDRIRNDVVDVDYIVESVGEHCNPEDVFTAEQLNEWAEENGYKKE